MTNVIPIRPRTHAVCQCGSELYVLTASDGAPASVRLGLDGAVKMYGGVPVCADCGVVPFGLPAPSVTA